ncbi:MAG: AI-2E family transporter [Chloroflexi bacterium]|nr:AI-2E family transporter [Chloroflexota bacterium]
MRREWSLSTRYFVLTFVLIALILFFWGIREILGPLVMAGLVAYILNPAIDFLERRARMGHKLAVNLVYFIGLGMLVAAPVLIVPLFINELKLLTQDLLDMLDQLQGILSRPVMIGGFSIDLGSILPRPDESLALYISKLPENALHILESTSRNAAWFLIIVVTIYYLLMDWDHAREWMIRIAPPAYRLDVRRVYIEVKRVWAAYLRGQLALMFIVGVIFTFVWTAIGLPGAIILGMLTGLFSLVPEIGPLAATLLALGVALLEGSNYLPLSNFWFGVLVVGIYVVLINFKNIWLRPRVMGRSVNLNEGLVFVAIIAAVIFSGVLGALIIVPMLASAIVIGRYLRARILGLPPFPIYDTPLVQELESMPAQTDKKVNPKRKSARK